MTGDKPQIRLWLIGLAAFAIVIIIGMQITTGNVTWGIIEHQSAGSAERVNEIQAQWRDAGVRNIAIVAMIGDLIFIGIYGWGSYVAGRSLSRVGTGVVRALGVVVAIAAVVFLITDYVETTLQFIQLVREQGSDWMAATAAFMQPIKIVAWIATFVGVIAGLLAYRYSRQTA